MVLAEQYWLNGQVVAPPRGLDALAFPKRRSDTFHSIIYQDLGWSELGGDAITFLCEVSRRILLDAWTQDGAAAVVTFRMLLPGVGVDYSGQVDMDSLTWDNAGVSCVFTDPAERVNLENGATRRLPVALSDNVYLPGFSLAGSVALSLPPALSTGLPAGLRQPGTTPLVLSVADNQRTGIDGRYTGTDGVSIWENTTTKPLWLTLSGTLGASVGRTDGGEFRVFTLFAQVLRPDGSVMGNWALGSLRSHDPGATVSDVALTLLIDERIQLPPGARLALAWRRLDTGTDGLFTVGYLARLTDLRLGVHTDTVPGSRLPAVRAWDVLASLVGSLSEGKLGFSSHYLSVGAGKSLYLSNVAALRGAGRESLQTSLQDAFVLLDKLRCLALWIDGNTVYVEDRKTYFTAALRRTAIDPARLQRVSYRPALGITPDQILLGPTDYVGEGLRTTLERIAPQRWENPRLPPARREVDLRISGAVISPLKIEQLRQLQFNGKDPDEVTTGDDEKLVVIEAGRFVPLSAYPLPTLSRDEGRPWPAYSEESLFNLSFHPVHQLLAHLPMLAGNSFRQVEALGYAAGAVVTQNAEPIFSGEQATLTTSLTRDEYSAQNGLVTFTDPDGPARRRGGNTYQLLVMAADWRQGADGENVCTITGLLLH